MKLCVVSGKPCWRDAAGNWMSYGGFPAQMDALRTLCDEMTIVVTDAPAREGGMPLPVDARVVALRTPAGAGIRRKLAVARGLPYYAGRIGRAVGEADWVHSPVPGDISYLGLLIAAFRRKPLFALYNGSWTPNGETTVMNRVTRGTMRLLAGGRNAMLVVGEGEAPPGARMRWLFATSFTRGEIAGYATDAERGLSDPPRLAYAGRLSTEKGIPVLLEAIARLAREAFSPLPRLTLAGGGSERGRLESQVAELGIGGLVSFAGQLDRPALARTLLGADVAVHPSRSEGYCKAWLDAMACGLPVLATEVGAARAVIGGEGVRGWLVPPDDPAALAAALRRVLTEPRDWPALRRRCRAYAESRTLEAWSDAIRPVRP